MVTSDDINNKDEGVPNQKADEEKVQQPKQDSDKESKTTSDPAKDDFAALVESLKDENSPIPDQIKDLKIESKDATQDNKIPSSTTAGVRKRHHKSRRHRLPGLRSYRKRRPGILRHARKHKRIGKDYGLKFTAEQITETMHAINPNYPSIYTQVIMIVLNDYKKEHPNEFLTARQILEKTHLYFVSKGIDKAINLISIYWSIKILLTDSRIEKTILKVPINNKEMWVMAFKAKNKEGS